MKDITDRMKMDPRMKDIIELAHCVQKSKINDTLEYLRSVVDSNKYSRIKNSNKNYKSGNIQVEKLDINDDYMLSRLY